MSIHSYEPRNGHRLPHDPFNAIVGPRLHTLYDLEALAFSANLVINDREMPYLEPVLRKGLRDYEKLFRPLIDALSGESASLL